MRIIQKTGSNEMTVREIITEIPNRAEYKQDTIMEIIRTYPQTLYREDLRTTSMKLDTKITYLATPDKVIMRLKNDVELFRKIIKKVFGYRPFTRHEYSIALGGVAEFQKQRLVCKFLFDYDKATGTYTLITDEERERRIALQRQQRKENVSRKWSMKSGSNQAGASLG
jgi:hypothetical protein